MRTAWLVLAGLLAGVPANGSIDVDLSWVDTGSPQWLRFEAWVDQAVAGSPGYAFSATDAAWVGKILADGPACALARQLVEDEVAEAEALIALGQRPPISYDSYLEVGVRIRDLALALDWCGAGMSPTDRQRWIDYAEQAVWNVWNPDDAVWGATPHPWSGWSVNDPGNNYHFSFLLGTVYHAAATDDAGWLAYLTTDRFPQLVAYYANLPGGGSREGTGYGLAHMNLFELLRLWRDLGHGDLAAQTPHARDSIDYWVHATVPTFGFVAPIGDQSRTSMPELWDYHRRIVLEARALAQDQAGRDLASWWLGQIPVDEMESGFNFRHDLLPAGTGGRPPTQRSYHATGVGQFFSRGHWGDDALWMAVVAGPYDQSHAHQEQGAFTLFRGDWLAVTENVFTHSGIQQGSDTNNVVRFVGPGAVTVPQRESVSSFSAADDGIEVHATADLSAAFASPTDGVTSWTRELDFVPIAGRLEVTDTYLVDAGVAALWQIQVPVEPVIMPDGTIHAGDLVIDPIVPAAPTIEILDWTTVDPSEFLAGWRVTLAGGSGVYEVRLTDTVTEARFVFADGFEAGDTSAWAAP
jgi:hypothetical protein